MIVPTGLPAWVHANDHTTYGGDVNKENYQAQDSVNGKTDVSAQELVRIAADIAALQRTASFATLIYQCNDTSPAVPTVLSYLAMAGTAPTGARVSDGRVTWTWAASYTDPYSQSGLIHVVGCIPTVASSAGGASANYILSDPDANTYNERVDVRAFTTGGGIADAIVTLTVYTGQI